MMLSSVVKSVSPMLRSMMSLYLASASVSSDSPAPLL